MIDHKCAIYWNGDKPEILWVYDSLEAADRVLQVQQEEIEISMNEWKKEAQAAVVKGELFSGGGILVVAELMRKHSAIVSLRTAMKH